MKHWKDNAQLIIDYPTLSDQGEYLYLRRETNEMVQRYHLQNWNYSGIH